MLFSRCRVSWMAWSELHCWVSGFLMSMKQMWPPMLDLQEHQALGCLALLVEAEQEEMGEMLQAHVIMVEGRRPQPSTGRAWELLRVRLLAVTSLGGSSGAPLRGLRAAWQETWVQWARSWMQSCGDISTSLRVPRVFNEGGQEQVSRVRSAALQGTGESSLLQTWER